MITVKAKLQGVKKLNRDVKTAHVRFRKAHDAAIKIVAYRRLKNMAQEIRSGAPGGQKYKELSTIARQNMRLKRGMSSRKPFTQLSGQRGNMGKASFLKGLPPIRYNLIKDGKGLIKEAEVGLTNKGIYPSGMWWIKAANLWQEGGQVRITDQMRERLARRGASLLKRSSRSKIAKRFFLKESTTSVKMPKRKIIQPFWIKWRSPSIKELNEVFKAKLAGKRVK